MKNWIMPQSRYCLWCCCKWCCYCMENRSNYWMSWYVRYIA